MTTPPAEEARTRYDLRHEPWLPVMTQTGHTDYVGLLQALTHAHTYRMVLGDHAGERVALLRLLCAVAWRAGARPADPPGALAGSIATYLESHRNGFDLLSFDRPFMQVPRLTYTRGDAAAGDLGVLTPGRGQFRDDRAVMMPLPQAARALVWAHAFSPAGITGGTLHDDRVQHGKAYPINTAWAGRGTLALLHGPTLADTIRLNLPTDHDTAPLPAPWEAPTPTRHEPLTPHAGVDLLTWPARRIRLLHNGTDVTAVIFSAGHAITDLDPLIGRDPAMTWTMTTLAPRTPTPRRLVYPDGFAPWQAIPALYDPSRVTAVSPALTALAHTTLDRVELELAGLHTDAKRVNVQDMTSEHYPRLPAAALTVGNPLHSQLLQACRATSAAVEAYATFTKNLAAAAGATPQASSSARDRGRQDAAALLTGPFRSWLARLPLDDSIEHVARWYRVVEQIILEAAAEDAQAAPPAAWQGRPVTTKTDSRYLNVPIAENFLRAQLRRYLEAHSLR